MDTRSGNSGSVAICHGHCRRSASTTSFSAVGGHYHDVPVLISIDKKKLTTVTDIVAEAKALTSRNSVVSAPVAAPVAAGVVIASDVTPLLKQLADCHRRRRAVMGKTNGRATGGSKGPHKASMPSSASCSGDEDRHRTLDALSLLVPLSLSTIPASQH